MINLGFLGSGTKLLWIMGESAGEGLWLLMLVTGWRWHVKGGWWHVKCDMSLKMHFVGKKMQKSVKMAGFHSIGAHIRICQGSWCLQYARFVLKKIYFIIYICSSLSAVALSWWNFSNSFTDNLVERKKDSRTGI